MKATRPIFIVTNNCLPKSIIYRSPLIMPKARRSSYNMAFKLNRVIAGHGLKYLEMYKDLATQAAGEGRALFLYNSKLHMNDHIFRNLAWEAEMAPVALNPMAWGVQLDEDLIGKASRLTRHVSSKPAFTIKRTLQRWLIASFAAWSKAEMLERI